MTHDQAPLGALKRATRASVAVCIPARDEEATIGAICRSIKSTLVRRLRLVDDVVVINSESRDATAERAEEAGATVYDVGDILPAIAIGPASGKGEALWRSLAVLDHDIIVWIDGDTRNFKPHFVWKLVAPLLQQDEAVLAKGYYDRPLTMDGCVLPNEGGRVTELALRPLLQLLYPPLTNILQPLSGDYAARRSAAIELPFFSGYGVDLGLLIDVAEKYGVHSIRQADLGARVHRNRDLFSLGRMSYEVVQTMLIRLQKLGVIQLRGELPTEFVQYLRNEELTFHIPVVERPPMRTILHAPDSVTSG